MEKLKEENKSLISLRTSLIAVLTVLNGGIAGLIVSDINIYKFVFLLIIGIYFDIVFISNLLTINKKINNNLKELI